MDTWRNQIKVYTHHSWKHLERMRPHKYQVLIPYQQVETDCFQRRVVPDLAVKLPSWWSHFRVPYGFLNVLPPLGTSCRYYFGRYPGYITVLCSKCACSFARQLIYEAHAGGFGGSQLLSQRI